MQSIGSTEVKVKSTSKSNGKKTPRRTVAKETLHLKMKEANSAHSEADITGMIATAAYFYAEHRRFEPGHELDDWLTAERMIKGTPYA